MTLIAIHMIQNHAPSNLNRDDNGDPKDCLFGGIRRARISSQALKRRSAHRTCFRPTSAISQRSWRCAHNSCRQRSRGDWKAVA